MGLAAIAQAGEVLGRAAALSSPGPYQVQAAIAAVHSEAPSWQETHWAQIVALYDTLLQMADTPVIRLNRAAVRRDFAVRRRPWARSTIWPSPSAVTTSSTPRGPSSWTS